MDKDGLNYYEILELDESVKSWSAIKSKIEKKQREWSRWKNQGTPAQKQSASEYLPELKKIEELLKNSDSREIERKEFIKRKNKIKTEKLKQLDASLDIIHENEVSSVQFAMLIKEFAPEVAEGEIEKRIIKRGKKIEKKGAKAKTPKKKREKIEISVAKSIVDDLKVFKYGNLYEYLEAGSNASHKALYDLADSKYKELSKTGKTDNDTTVKKRLAGHAKSVFKTTDEKRKYDNTLEDENLSVLDHFLKIAGSDKYIDEKEIELLLKKGKENGISKETTMEYIEEIANKRKWGIQRPKSDKKIVLLSCGFCGELAEKPNQDRCKKCGEKLIQPCPLCSNPTPTEQSACSKCGCTTGDRSIVQKLMISAKKNKESKNYGQSIVDLDEILSLWKNYKPATDEIKEVQSLKKKENDSLLEIEVLVKKKFFSEASSKLSYYQKLFGAGISQKTLKSKIDIKLQNAEKLFSEGEQKRKLGKIEEAFNKYEETLSFCADFTDAKSAISKLPLPLPKNVTARWLNATLHLSWTAGKLNSKIDYIVTRKENGAPSRVEDGTKVGETSNLSMDDTKIRSGVVYYYGIFPARGGVASKKSVNLGPYLLPGEATEIKYRASNQEIIIHWKPAFGSIATEVWRHEGTLSFKRGVGKLLKSSSRSITDTKLTNGKEYSYLLVSKYNDSERKGKYVYSGGVKIKTTPAAPPKVIGDLSIERNNNIYILSWTKVESDTRVEIRQSTNSYPTAVGQVVSSNELDSYGVPIPINSSNRTQTTINAQGTLYFTPITIRSETAVIGKMAQMTTLDDVSSLTTRQVGDSIFLEWNWPKNSKQALVIYRNDHFASSVKELGNTKKLVTLVNYKENGYFEVRTDKWAKHYLTVYIKDPNSEMYSSGKKILETMGQETAVKYTVKNDKRFFTRKIISAWVNLESKTPNLELENLIMVIKKKTVPISKHDGEMVCEVKNVIFEENHAKIEIPEKFWKRSGYIKIFFIDKVDAEDIRLLPGSLDDLKLN